MNRICVVIVGGFSLWAAIPAHACDWTGAGADDNWSTAANWEFCGGTPPEGGETLVFPDSASRKTNFNDIAGLNVGQLVFNGWEYHISGNGIELSFGIVVNLPQPEPPLPGVAHFPHLELDIVLVNDQTFESFFGTNLSTLTVAGTISGAYDLTKAGEGPIVFTGDNSYSGLTKITEGTLLIDGNQAAGGGVIVSGGGILGGIGTAIWIDSAPGATVSPGRSPGVLTAAGGVELGNASILRIELQGPEPGSGHDQLVAGSTDFSAVVSLAGADGPTLQVVAEFAPSPGTEFTIIDNRTTNPVLGTFAGLPEGAMFAAGGRAFQISYSGGDGNDVVLIAVDDTLFRDRFED